MTETAPVVADHPAKWSVAVLDVMRDICREEEDRIGRPLRVLDPFAGVGRARLADALHPYALQVDGVELQPEWGDAETVLGDATVLPFPTGTYDAVATSPCYGNRCADHHQAADPCKACGGYGGTCILIHDGSPHSREHCRHAQWRDCKTCKGTGLSWRNTYAHALRRAGAELVPGSAAAMQWARPYRLFHRDALREMIRVTVPGGLLVINMSNHFRTLVKGQPSVEQQVVEWWVNQIIVAGCFLRAVLPVDTPGNRNGANRDVRTEHEVVIVAHTPNPRRTS